MNNCSTNHLYLMSFVVGSDSGLALASATSERQAEQLLRNGGRYNGSPSKYTILQTRDIGLASTLRTEILMESYVNALVAFDAIMSIAQKYEGPRGKTGLSAYEIAVQHGYSGTEQEWVSDLNGETGDAAGFGVITASFDAEDGVPYVDVTQSGPATARNIDLAFHGVKGQPGVSVTSIEQTKASTTDGGNNIITVTLSDGTTSDFVVKNGRTGVTSTSASVDNLPGTASVVTSIENGLLTFSFYGLKGQQGNPGTNNTTMTVVEELPAAASASPSVIYLMLNDETGDYDRYFVQETGSGRSWVQAGSVAIDLSDYKRSDSEVWLTQDEFDALEVKDITKTYNVYEDQEEV